MIGWRWWWVASDGSLRGVYNDDTPWPPDEPLVAQCHRGHVAPDEDCTCGSYFYRWPEDAVVLPRSAGYAQYTTVFGCCELWGRIVEHELGFRAQYAKPVAIWVARDPAPHRVYHLDRHKTLASLLARWDVDDGTNEPNFPTGPTSPTSPTFGP